MGSKLAANAKMCIGLLQTGSRGGAHSPSSRAGPSTNSSMPALSRFVSAALAVTAAAAAVWVLRRRQARRQRGESRWGALGTRKLKVPHSAPRVRWAKLEMQEKLARVMKHGLRVAVDLSYCENMDSQVRRGGGKRWPGCAG